MDDVACTTCTSEHLPASCAGQYLPKDQLPNGMVTDLAWWKGPYTNSSDTPQTR